MRNYEDRPATKLTEREVEASVLMAQGCKNLELLRSILIQQRQVRGRFFAAAYVQLF